MPLEKEYRVLAVNPGSTFTKFGVYDNEVCLLEKTIYHEFEQLDNALGQYPFRKNSILETLDIEGINISKINAVCARGGLLRPIEGGTYLVNDEMLNDLRAGYSGQHVSNLGGLIAEGIASGLNIPAFIVDPVVVDEMAPVARISGFSLLERKSIFHALNQKAAAKRVAKELEKKYGELNLIVAHMSEGITVGIHQHGRVVDVNNGLNGDGPFSLERAGTVPIGDLIDLCYSGKYSRAEMMKMMVGNGGVYSYLETNEMFQVKKMIKNGDEKAKLIYEAMAYQIAKEIGGASTVLFGKIDAIILTGSLAQEKRFVKSIIERISWIADIIVQPGQNELQALNEGALRVLRGEEEVKVYPGNFDVIKIKE